jgi:endo-1,4-beta-xylanase
MSPSPLRFLAEGVLLSELPGVIPFAIALRLPVDGFGDVALYADNGGRGFTPADFPLNLNVAFAQTRLNRVQTALRRWQSQGFSFSGQIEQRLGRARRAIDEAIATSTLPAKVKLCNAAESFSIFKGLHCPKNSV